jgi:hypothetical protein
MQEKYKEDYEKYVIILESDINVALNLKVYSNVIKNKYGQRMGQVLWDKFVKEYANK